MSALALRAPSLMPYIVQGGLLRWYAIVAALLVPVVILRIADARLRAAA